MAELVAMIGRNKNEDRENIHNIRQSLNSLGVRATSQAPPTAAARLWSSTRTDRACQLPAFNQVMDAEKTDVWAIWAHIENVAGFWRNIDLITRGIDPISGRSTGSPS